ncbi:MAG: penicillin-binding protein activator LpoB [Spirochaetales bacterium]|nr:penicillin-binding protein activator LpoB [Spirochaetales bacterium]
MKRKIYSLRIDHCLRSISLKRTKIILVAATAIFLSAGCVTTSVSRTATDEVIDLSGRWNDTDARLTAEVLINDVLSRPWLLNFVEEESTKPVVIIGSVRNKSSEHIDLLPLIKSFQMELINSGKVKFVADAKAREEIRSEREDQQSNASEDTATKLADETGADFMLQGVITTTVDAVDGKRVVLYQTNLELVDLRSNEIVWLGEKGIKKLVEQAKASW